jgi:hypothetical protein
MINTIFEDDKNNQLEAYQTVSNQLCIYVKDIFDMKHGIELDLEDANELIKVLKRIVANIKKEL